MDSDQPAEWKPKIGDKVIRRPRIRAHHLRRVLGIPESYSAGYGNVSSSIYYALGVVPLVEIGTMPVVLGFISFLRQNKGMPLSKEASTPAVVKVTDEAEQKEEI